MLKKILTIFIFTALVASAQAQTAVAKKEPVKTEDPDNLLSDYFSQVMGVALSATSNLKLYQFVYDWIGTPYRFGGSSRNGIDCSAFTKEIYSKVFNTVIQRNSREIFSMSTPVSREELKEGDLVFFKINSRSISHVGIYLGNNRFAHASSSRGVVLSNLNDPYYKRYFYKGGRLNTSVQ
ncbi:MAG: NlpC/P60 family protein [Sphingobacteriales bacterium]|jgi:lipoprotein Spr|nr:NlpC/P60 family protein [Sphingobacteriales bacterium]